MKILYATQATGNGHLVRALEIVPFLRQQFDVEVFVSGCQAQVELPFSVDYQKYGLSFSTSKRGGISYLKTARSLRPIKLIRDIKACKLSDYDLVINDFEPITAWACRIKKVPILAMSHQASFFSEKTPRPEKLNRKQEFILRNYAPAKHYIGFHFESYDENILPPVIPRDIRQLEVDLKNEICVYLPSYHPKFLANHFKGIKHYRFRIFSPFVRGMESHQNLEFHPVSREGWLSAFRNAGSVIMGAGFEGPAEVLHHGKRLMVIPMQGQYEQVCNAEALKRLGVNVQSRIQNDFEDRLRYWLEESKSIQIVYPDQQSFIIDRIGSNVRA